MNSHELDYKLLGDDLQLVEVELDPGEVVVAEAGAMCYMDEGISFESKMGDGTDEDKGFFGKLAGAGKRMLAGESIFMTHFLNSGSGKKTVSFAAPFPGKIAALDLRELGGEFFCQKEAFLCAAKGTNLSIAFTKKFGAGFFGGEGFILEKLTGDGLAFIHAGGTLIKKDLNNDALIIDTGCIVGFTGGIEYDIQKAGNMKSMFFGGEGFFLATLKGTGSVYLQSLPFSRLADRIIQNIPKSHFNDQN